MRCAGAAAFGGNGGLHAATTEEDGMQWAWHGVDGPQTLQARTSIDEARSAESQAPARLTLHDSAESHADYRPPMGTAGDLLGPRTLRIGSAVTDTGSTSTCAGSDRNSTRPARRDNSAVKVATSPLEPQAGRPRPSAHQRAGRRDGAMLRGSPF
jgi:hypothetical protein